MNQSNLIIKNFLKATVDLKPYFSLFTETRQFFEEMDIED